MRFIIMPITDAKIVFTEKELETMRKSIDNTKVIIHEEILVAKREIMGITTLPSEETGSIEWPYPVYAGSSIRELLASGKWCCDAEGGVMS